mmetsp:Transcript_69697/g.167306  ORF Transcript_69697/g.167306 Transcript_69697/m.167306 type:complete len:204 (-) Transcript_69697:1497-2108(-)
MKECHQDVGWQLHRQLLRPRPRLVTKWLRPSNVCDPVDEVEADITFRCATLADHLSEAFEQRSRRCLPLNQPAIVEVHLALCEKHRSTLCWGKVTKAWQEGRIVLQDVSQSQVMVCDLFAFAVSSKGRMLRLDPWQQNCVLHDVVDGCECKHGCGPLDDDGNPSISLADKQARTGHQILKGFPVHAVEKLCLLAVRLANSRLA